MTTIRTAGRAGTILTAFALTLAACGSSTPSAAPGSGGTSGATSTPAASSGAALPSQAPGPSGFPIPSIDIGALTAGLSNVDSYRIAITVAGVEQYKGVVVTKPVLSRDITISGGTRFVVIGNEAWTAQGSEPLKSVPSQLATSMFAAFDPTLMVGAFSSPQWAQSSLDKGTEQKNGVSAHHLVIDSTTLVGGLSGIAAGGAINFWIADAGYLVAWEATGLAAGAGDTSIEVTNVDDPANKVERPS
ncbi:MAG: hypothetical protein ABI553_05445 [Chloroflexota bacterium]